MLSYFLQCCPRIEPRIFPIGPVGIVGDPSVFNSPVSARLKSACKMISRSSGCIAPSLIMARNTWVS